MTFHHATLATQIREGGKILKGAVIAIIISLIEHLLQARSGSNAFAYVIPRKLSSTHGRELLQSSVYRRGN